MKAKSLLHTNLQEEQASLDIEERGVSSEQDRPVKHGTAVREATTAGKLQEIDLGPSTSRANELRTAQATKNRNSQPVPEAQRHKQRKGLGPDGKPWRNKKNRRTEEDIKRDALVESIMSEAPIDALALTPAPVATVSSADADAEMLHEFQREYYDAQQSRHQRKPPPLTGKDKEADAKVKGPRLGGSRSARAAMHKSMQDEAAKKKR
jgi:hypothetical protein